MPRTLLIVDDNKSVRDSLRLMLEDEGYTVLVAGTGAEAIALWGQAPIHGAMIDVNMPGINGLALCRTLRTYAAEAGWSLPVWMMTGARTPEMERGSLESGALLLLPKPFQYAELRQMFRSQFGEPAPASADQNPSIESGAR